MDRAHGWVLRCQRNADEGQVVPPLPSQGAAPWALPRTGSRRAASENSCSAHRETREDGVVCVSDVRLWGAGARGPGPGGTGPSVHVDTSSPHHRRSGGQRVPGLQAGAPTGNPALQADPLERTFFWAFPAVSSPLGTRSVCCSRAGRLLMEQLARPPLAAPFSLAPGLPETDFVAMAPLLGHLSRQVCATHCPGFRDSGQRPAHHPQGVGCRRRCRLGGGLWGGELRAQSWGALICSLGIED